MEKKNKEENILSQAEIEEELRLAEIDERPANFKGKVLANLILNGRTIETSLDLEAAIILNAISLESALIKGDLNLNYAVTKGVFYFGSGILQGNLNLENAKINGGVNLVGAKITGSLFLNGLNINGFLSLAKIQLKGNLESPNLKIMDSYHGGLIVKGDVYLREANIIGRVNLEKSFSEGSGDFLNAFIGKELNLKETVFENFLILKGAKIRGETILEGTKYKELIK